MNRFFVPAQPNPIEYTDKADWSDVWYDKFRDEFYVQIGSDLYTRRLSVVGGHTDDLGNKYILYIKQNFSSMAEIVFESVGSL